MYVIHTAANTVEGLHLAGDSLTIVWCHVLCRVQHGLGCEGKDCVVMAICSLCIQDMVMKLKFAVMQLWNGTRAHYCSVGGMEPGPTTAHVGRLEPGPTTVVLVEWNQSPQL